MMAWYKKASIDSNSNVRFAEFDFVGDQRRSWTGYVFTLSGCVINWEATLQSMIVLSTT